MAQVYIAYAHPISEDSEVFWMAAGTTTEKAMERLVAKVAEGWDSEDEDETQEERMARIRAEIDSPSDWVVLWDEDTLE